MKIIISHDVDHLYRRDHIFRDFVYPKLLIRETLRLLKKQISMTEWAGRCLSCTRHDRNHIAELMDFDKRNGIISTFFFGMESGLGMSYKPSEAKSIMNAVKENGFDVGVHGICYDDINGIRKEKKTFINTMGYSPTGIRMHYVRFNNDTFNYLNITGYEFDSSDFNKQNGVTLKSPYKIGEMWEFPVMVMDTYLPYNVEKAKEITMKTINEALENGIDYCVVLFHDIHFSKDYKEYKLWYEWLIDYLKKDKSNRFITYLEAIKELEKKDV